MLKIIEHKEGPQPLNARKPLIVTLKLSLPRTVAALVPRDV